MMSICIYSSTIHWSGNLDRQWATEPDLASVVSNTAITFPPHRLVESDPAFITLNGPPQRPIGSLAKVFAYSTRLFLTDVGYHDGCQDTARRDRQGVEQTPQWFWDGSSRPIPDSHGTQLGGHDLLDLSLCANI